ncbi:MAG: FtsX-like permease family protein [Geodermatophilaceae bacterium]
MLGYLRDQLRHSLLRASVLGVGILVAAVSFSLLTAAVDTSQAQVVGTVDESFRSAYDVLVRPQGTQTELERADGLVQANFQSGIYGGITEAQWQQILDLPGVEVAAPVANVGQVLVQTFVTVPLPEAEQVTGEALYRLESAWTGVNGTSVFPAAQGFVYVTDEPDFCTADAGGVAADLIPIRGFPTGAFPPNDPTKVDWNCFSPRTDQSQDGQTCWSYPGDIEIDGTSTCRIEAYVPVVFPMLVTGIDPEQENRLVGIQDTVLSGRMLGSEDAYTTGQGGSEVPVLVSSRTYSDAALRLDLKRAQLPAGEGFQNAVVRDAPGDPQTGNNPYRNMLSYPTDDIRSSVSGSQQLYDLALAELPSFGYLSGYWSSGAVSYQRDSGGVLTPHTAALDPQTWFEGSSFTGYAAVPATNADVQYRAVAPHEIQDFSGIPGSGQGRVLPVGTFDPELLPGFDPLSAVPLEAYSPPVATAADAATEQVLGGEPYRPSLNVGGYLTEPPFMLTTIDGVHGFTDPRFFAGGNNEAPISVIRVRVDGVTGADEESLARIKLVAADIATQTGLDVDITAGSSPQPQTIRLQASPYGTPGLLLTENWVAKGVAIQILSEVDRKSLFLLGLILVVSVLFLVNAGVAAVRARRPEFATLMCLGWRSRSIFAAVFAELVTVGLVAGVLGTALAFGISSWFGLQQPAWRLLLVAPVSLLLAVVSGIIPARIASRGSPLDALAPPGGPPWAGMIRGVTTLAVANLRRARGRTALAVMALMIGVGALAGLLVISGAFRGVVAGTLLGNVVAVQVRAVDYVTTGLVLVLAAAAIADVLVLSMRERAVELVTLRVTGWSDRQLARLVLTEGLGIGLLGSALGAAVGVGVGVAIGAGAGAVATAAVIAGGVGLGLTALASVVPAVAVSRLPVGVASAEA